MKKLVFLFIILWLVSCQSNIVKQKTNTWNLSTWSKIETNTWLQVNTWNVYWENKKLVWTWIVELTWTIDAINRSDSTWEKDIVIVKNKENSSSWNIDDFSWKTQQEVVDEMWTYVDDLFNIVEKDVK